MTAGGQDEALLLRPRICQLGDDWRAGAGGGADKCAGGGRPRDRAFTTGRKFMTINYGRYKGNDRKELFGALVILSINKAGPIIFKYFFHEVCAGTFSCKT